MRARLRLPHLNPTPETSRFRAKADALALSSHAFTFSFSRHFGRRNDTQFFESLSGGFLRPIDPFLPRRLRARQAFARHARHARHGHESTARQKERREAAATLARRRDSRKHVAR